MGTIRVILDATLLFIDKGNSKVLRQYKLDTTDDVDKEKFAESKKKLLENLDIMRDTVERLEVKL